MSDIAYFFAGCFVGSICTFFSMCIAFINCDYDGDGNEAEK